MGLLTWFRRWRGVRRARGLRHAREGLRLLNRAIELDRRLDAMRELSFEVYHPCETCGAWNGLGSVPDPERLGDAVRRMLREGKRTSIEPRLPWRPCPACELRLGGVSL